MLCMRLLQFSRKNSAYFQPSSTDIHIPLNPMEWKMTLKFQINGFRCNQETSGKGSDEIAFIIAGLPCDKDSWGGPVRWTYSDLERHWRVRWATDIDSGDHHDFEYPISFEQEVDPTKGLEIIFYLMEIDGAQRTKKQALEEHDRIKANIERDFVPGNPVGARRLSLSTFSRDYRALDADPDSGAGFLNDSPEDVLARNVWHIDLERPLAGSLLPEAYERSAVGPELGVPGNPDVYRVMMGDEMVETRSYENTSEGSRYTFDARYSLVP